MMLLEFDSLAVLAYQVSRAPSFRSLIHRLFSSACGAVTSLLQLVMIHTLNARLQIPFGCPIC